MVDDLGQLPITLRPIEQADSIADLTRLLHRAYAGLAQRGLHFVASHQDEQTTRRRIERGECHLAFHHGALIGTITLYAPGHKDGSPWLDRPDVAILRQFAVEPAHQRRGVGSRLLELVERRAREMGAVELALDTAEPATDLIRYYEKRGFRFIEHVRWTQVNYRSVVMSKRL